MAAGILQVVTEGELQAQQKRAIDTAETSKEQLLAENNLSGYIRGVFYQYRNKRTEENIDTRIYDSLLSYNGQYSAQKLSEIKQFGGSDVYARLITVKCRGTTAMLRDVFLSNEQPWALKPTPVPAIPGNVLQDIDQLVSTEVLQMGQLQMESPQQPQIEQRRAELGQEALRAVNEQATKAAKGAEKKLQDMLVEGGFYTALGEFLIDLPIYPYACIKGPVVQMTEQIKWDETGTMGVVREPKMFWRRVDPMNLYFTPGVSDVADSIVIEKMKMSRADFNDLIGIPGYDEEQIRGVLNDYEHGLRDWLDNYDTQYATAQSKEDPNTNVSELIDCLEWHGPVKGKLLLDQGFDAKEVPDGDLDYHVTCWVVGQYVIKMQITPNPSKRPMYYLTSFEKVPGALPGHGLPEIINDIQDIANASVRSLVNNMSISSGPQVSVFEDMLSPTTDADSLYPWKRWRFNIDPMSPNITQPISFFQPDSHAQELLSIYQTMTVMADEISAIPRYMTGSQNTGSGAASTASGLSMLMNNASKVLQNIAANIDTDVMQPVLQTLYDIVMLTDDTGLLKGDENIAVQGVSVAMQRETDRMRQLEFLSLTANPIDMEITGMEGRASVLRSISNGLGLEGEKIVPSNDELRQKVVAQQEQAAQAQGSQGQAQGDGAGRPEEQTDNMQRVRSPQAMASR